MQSKQDTELHTSCRERSREPTNGFLLLKRASFHISELRLRFEKGTWFQTAVMMHLPLPLTSANYMLQMWLRCISGKMLEVDSFFADASL